MAGLAPRIGPLGFEVVVLDDSLLSIDLSNYVTFVSLDFCFGFSAVPRYFLPVLERTNPKIGLALLYAL